MGPGCASRDGRFAWPPPSEAHGYVGCTGICHHHRDKEWAHPPGSLLEQHPVLLFERTQTPYARAHNHSGSVRVDLKLPCVLYGESGGSHVELAEAVHAASFLGVEPVRRIEVLGFPTSLGGG